MLFHVQYKLGRKTKNADERNPIYMKFAQLFCNGKQNPIGIGREICFHWNYASEGKRNETQTAFRLTVRDPSHAVVIDTGIIESSEMQYILPKTDILQACKPYFWEVRAFQNETQILSETQTFELALENLAASDWIDCGLSAEDDPSSPIFEKSFFVSDDVIRARLYISGLGLISCKINGKNCDNGFLTPAYTAYDKQVYFETIDMTPFLQKGKNLLTVQLGNGYNKDYSQWGDRYFTPKGFRAAICLTDIDGQTQRMDTDESWQWKNSPITENGLYLGEKYDARLQFTETHPAIKTNEHAPKGILLPNEMPPIRVMKEIQPFSQWDIPGGTVYDFGNNMQGICRIEVSAPEGCIISLQHSEMITPEGTLDTFTNRRARAKDIYICRGEGLETYQPLFTYHGFRYVFAEHSLPLDSFKITALFLSADVGEKAFFHCSEPIVNRIHSLSTTSIRSNLVSIPTDCPMRDERTACLMDSQMYEDAAMYNFNMYAYYKKWLHDNTANRERLAGNMDWNGDTLMLAYRMYLFYGETEMARKLYPFFKKSIEAWFAESENGVWTQGYGDWCLPNENTWESFFGCAESVNTSLLHAYTGIMAEFATLFGFPADREYFLSVGESIRNAFIERFWHEDGTVANGRQPAMLTPLYYGILTGEKAEKTKAALLKTIRQDRYFDTGGFSLRTILPVLADANALDLFLETIRYNQYPGFGYWVAMGATSLWEQWAIKGRMHSHNHAMHSGIEAALFQTLCGVVPTAPMFRTFRIAPKLPSDMHNVCCKLNTYSGKIEVSAEKIGDTLVISLSVPPNTQAELTFPDFESYQNCLLFDGERKTEKAETLLLGSGNYTFRLIPEEYIRFQPYQ